MDKYFRVLRKKVKDMGLISLQNIRYEEKKVYYKVMDDILPNCKEKFLHEDHKPLFIYHSKLKSNSGSKEASPDKNN